MCDRAKGVPKKNSRFSEWRANYDAMVKPYEEGTELHIVESAIGDQVVFDDFFPTHILDAKQIKEKRWQIVPNALDIITKPDEVFRQTIKHSNGIEINTVYIKYYENEVLALATNRRPSKGDKTIAKTIYGENPLAAQSKMKGSRKGILMYRK
jgi:hypothetical protein